MAKQIITKGNLEWVKPKEKYQNGVKWVDDPNVSSVVAARVSSMWGFGGNLRGGLHIMHWRVYDAETLD